MVVWRYNGRCATVVGQSSGEERKVYIGDLDHNEESVGGRVKAAPLMNPRR